jgi:transposase
MAESHPIELRIRAVVAYESGEGSYPEIADQFVVGVASVKRWVRLHRLNGDVTPTPKGGGTPSSVTLDDIQVALAKVLDATAGELTAEVNRSRRRPDRVHVSSIKRALRRHGYVVKKSDDGHWRVCVPTSSSSVRRT